MSIRTKIVCTMGPAVDSEEGIATLIAAGMNVARINFSHGTYEQHAKVIDRLKAARLKSGKPLAIMLDTKGPEVRIGQLPVESIDLAVGQTIKLAPIPESTDESIIPVVPGNILANLNQGDIVLFNDGYVRSTVVEIVNDGVVVEISNAGKIQSRKGINIPDVLLDLPMITEQDKADIKFGCEHNVDIVAASFVNTPEHILSMKHLLAQYGRSDMLVIAKIESRRGLDSIDDIVQVADGIMVARGDLGVEVPLAQVPGLQKMMIRKCYLAGKPSITATQMLESMIESARPTRAEASDVANAIYDSTSAVMLSGETAIGKYPFDTVHTMGQIVGQAEKEFDYTHFLNRDFQAEYQDVRTAVTLAAVKTASRANAKAIFVITNTGRAARLVSRLRPSVPIIALTFTEKVYNQLAVLWGVVPICCEGCSNMVEARAYISQWSLDNGYVNYGDLVVTAAGTPFGVSGSTNMMIVDSIGDVLIRGLPGCGPRLSGEVERIFNPTDADLTDKIAVISRCDDSYLPVLKNAKGVILQNQPDDTESERYLLLVAPPLNLSTVIRADGAMEILEEGQSVTLDPREGIVFNGIVGS